PPGGLGDVTAAGQVQRADSEVAQAGHDARAGAGVGEGVVFAVDGVAQPVQRLHAPVVADQPRDIGRGSLGGVQVGDPECGDRGGRGAGQIGDVAFDQPYLVDVGEREIRWGGQGLDGAGGDPAVSAVGQPVGDRGVGPGQCVERGEQTGLVVLDGEHEPGAALVQVGGVVALAVESVGGDHQPGRVDAGGGQLVDQRGEHGDLVGLRADLDLAEHQLLAVGRGREQVGLMAVVVD